MSERWRSLPSLSALRAFDATARHGGFAGAGRILNVTHAAVTQAVRGLEADLGVQLVRRAGRSVTLTEAGAQLAQALDQGFGTITTGLDGLRRSQERRPLRVATTMFIGETCILPRLAEFWALHPGVEVAMTPSQALVDFQSDGFDLAIRAMTDGAPDNPTEERHALIRTPVIAVCAPALRDQVTTAGRPLEAQDLPWLIEAGNSWDESQLRAADIDVDRLRRVRLGSPYLEMSAARRGLGAIVATEVICRDDLKAGRLVVLPFDLRVSLTYAAVIPRGPRRPAVDQFADWLAAIF